MKVGQGKRETSQTARGSEKTHEKCGRADAIYQERPKEPITPICSPFCFQNKKNTKIEQ